MGDKRPTKLTEKHLTNATDEQKKLHLWLIELANTHVAHCDREEYDKVTIRLLIINNDSGKAVNIEITQDFYEPLACNDFQEMLKLLRIIRLNIALEFQQLRTKIIDDYNKLG